MSTPAVPEAALRSGVAVVAGVEAAEVEDPEAVMAVATTMMMTMIKAISLAKHAPKANYSTSYCKITY